MSKRVIRSVLWGAGIGALVIGLGARGAMRLIAIIVDLPRASSMGGTMEILVYAAMPGAAGGLVSPALRRFRPSIAGLLLGTVMFAITLLTLPGHIAEAVGKLHTPMPAIVALFGPPFLLAGWLIVRFPAGGQRRVN